LAEKPLLFVFLVKLRDIYSVSSKGLRINASIPERMDLASTGMAVY